MLEAFAAWDHAAAKPELVASTLFGGRSPWIPLLSPKSSYYMLDVIGSDLVRSTPTASSSRRASTTRTRCCPRKAQ